jgi:hypothetical protein
MPLDIYINLYRHSTISGRTCPTLVRSVRHWYEGSRKKILFRWLSMTLILVDHETCCIEKIIYLSFYTYEERINRRSYGSCASIWRQGGLGPRDWLEVRLCNSELDWIFTLACVCPWLSSTLLMSHMSSMIHSFMSREQKKKELHKDWDVSSGYDVEEEAEQCH